MSGVRSRMLRAPVVRRAQTAALLAAFILGFGIGPAAAQKTPQNFNVLPITITSVTVENGQLFANGLMGSEPFRSLLTLSAERSRGPGCPILNLELGPIFVNVLGLQVETSAICLDITAFQGGGLLGDLLCNVANLLERGASVADVVRYLERLGQLDEFLNGLTSVLDQVMDRITSNDALAGASCTVLNLALGPIELNLLGLVVELDDCANGPVTVDITAIPGGGLLGDLLCSLADLLDNNAAVGAINTVLWQISRVLGQLLG